MPTRVLLVGLWLLAPGMAAASPTAAAAAGRIARGNFADVVGGCRASARAGGWSP